MTESLSFKDSNDSLARVSNHSTLVADGGAAVTHGFRAAVADGCAAVADGCASVADYRAALTDARARVERFSWGGTESFEFFRSEFG